MILDRGAGCDHLEGAGELHGCLAALGGHVFDRLGLVEDDRLPPDRGKQLAVLLQKAVAANDQVERPQPLQNFFPLVSAVDDAPERRREFSGLALPVQTDRGGGDDERRPVRSHGEDLGQRLHRFSQTHVVGKAGPHAPVSQAVQPVEPLYLVAAQFGLQRVRYLGAEGLRFTQTFKLRPPLLVTLECTGVGREILEERGGEGMEAEGRSVRVAAGGEVVEVSAQLRRKGDELAVAQLHESPLCTARQFNQFPEVEGELLVHLHLAGKLEIVLRLPHGKLAT